MQLRLSGSSVDTENEAEKIQQELERMLADRQAKLGMPGIAVGRQRLVSLLGENSNNLKRFDQTIIDYYSDRIIGKESFFGLDFSKVAELLSTPHTNVPALHAQICSIRLEPLFRDLPAPVRDQIASQESVLLAQFCDTVQKVTETEYTQKAVGLQMVTKNRAGFNAYMQSNSADKNQVQLTTKIMLDGFTQLLNTFRDDAVFQQVVLPPIVRLYEQHVFSQALHFGEEADYEDVLLALAFYYRLRLITLGFNDYSDEAQQVVFDAMLSVKTSPDKQWSADKIKSHLDQIRLDCFENCKNSSLHQVVYKAGSKSWDECETEIDALFDTQYQFVSRRLQRTVTVTLDHAYAKVKFNQRVEVLIHGENGFVSKIRGQHLGHVFTALEECIAAQQRLLETDDFSMLAKEDKDFRSSLSENLLAIISERFNVGILVLRSFANIAQLINTPTLPGQANELDSAVKKIIADTYRGKRDIDDVIQLMYQYKAILEYTLDSVVFNQHFAPVLSKRFEAAILEQFSDSIMTGCQSNYQVMLDLVFTSYRLKLRATADFSDKKFDLYAAFLAKLDSSQELSAKDQLSQIRVECFSTHHNSPLRTSIASAVDTLMSQGNSTWQVCSESIETIFKKEYSWLPQAAAQGFLGQFRQKYAQQVAAAPQPGVFFAHSPRAAQVEEAQVVKVLAEEAQHEEVLGGGLLDSKNN